MSWPRRAGPRGPRRGPAVGRNMIGPAINAEWLSGRARNRALTMILFLLSLEISPFRFVFFSGCFFDNYLASLMITRVRLHPAEDHAGRQISTHALTREMPAFASVTQSLALWSDTM